MRFLSAPSICSIVLGLSAILFIAFIRNCSHKVYPLKDFFLITELLIVCGALGCNIVYNGQTRFIRLKPLMLSALLCQLGLIYALLSLLSTIIHNWGTYTYYFECLLVSLVSTALANTHLFLVSTVIWICKLVSTVKAGDPIKFPKDRNWFWCFVDSLELILIPDNGLVTSLLLASMLNIFVFGSYFLEDFIYLLSGVLGVAVAFEYPNCKKSVLIVTKVVACFSIFAHICSLVDFYFKKPCHFNFLNSFNDGLFLSFNFLVVCIIQLLICKKQKSKAVKFMKEIPITASEKKVKAVVTVETV